MLPETVLGDEAVRSAALPRPASEHTRVPLSRLFSRLGGLGKCISCSMRGGVDIVGLDVGYNLKSVTVDDIYSEEEKDILIVVKLPKLTAETAKFDAIEFSLQYTNLLNQNQEYQHATATIARPAAIPKQMPLPAVDKQRNRMIYTNAMQEALSAVGQQQNFSAATQALDRAQQAILGSVTAADHYCVSLVEQLQENRRDVASQEAYRRNQARLNTTTVSHLQQRSTHTAGSSSYTTSSKRTMTQGYTTFEEKGE